MSWKQMLGCGLAVLSLMACGDEDEELPKRGHLVLREGRSVDELPECRPDVPRCDGGSYCSQFTLDGVIYLRCLPSGNVCEELFACTGDTVCITLTSDPPQLACDFP